MLTKCPECELQISDKALSCPHCGYPLKPEVKTRKYNSKRHRRLPNGFGQISEIKSRNLRKPFRAMITVGKDENGRPICKPLQPEAYFETYNDAYMALVAYNRNPYDLDPDITVKELYNRWFPEYQQKVEVGSYKAINFAWKHCVSLYDIRVKDLRAHHIKSCIEHGTSFLKGFEHKPLASTKSLMKTLFNQMLDYAVEYELVDKNYARTFKLPNDTIREITTVKKEHIPFSEEEMRVLWENINDDPFISVVLIQCYSGWRPQEMCLLRLENINFEDGIFTGGLKTDAGKKRIVPIHSRIRPLVEAKYKEAQALGSSFLFNYTNPEVKLRKTEMSYNRYRECFDRVKEKYNLNPEHRPHDGRKHFVTMAKKYGVDEYAIKYIVGHKILDITERVYTQRELSWLINEMEKIV